MQARKFGLQSLLLVYGAFFSGKGLRPDYTAEWAKLAAQSVPLLDNGTLIGFNLGAADP